MTLKPLWIALSTYSVLPTPQFAWEEKNIRSSLCFLPVVGVACGAAGAAWYAFCRKAGVSGVLFAAVAVCLPLLLTGGIHMDGYLDTVDALSSRQPMARKLEILKDSHCGAFAIIYGGIYLLLSFGLVYELYGARLYPAVCPGFVLSRALSVLCALNLPGARKNGMLAVCVHNAPKRAGTAAMLAVTVLSGGTMLLLSPPAGAAAIALLCGLLVFYPRLALRQFGGVTGDTAGFFLQLCELAILLGCLLGGSAI